MVHDDRKRAKRKTRLWILDPSMYESQFGPSSRWSYLLAGSKTVGFYGFILALFLYPVFVIYMGLQYGWVGFWGTFLGSTALVGLLISKAGYGRNFQNAGTGSFLKRIVGLVLGFGSTVAFYEGFFILKQWFVLVFILILLLGLSVKIMRG